MYKITEVRTSYVSDEDFENLKSDAFRYNEFVAGREGAYIPTPKLRDVFKDIQHTQ